MISVSPSAQGGEFGVDPARAAEDPVAYIIVLDVIRAHYLAGLDAFDAGETQAAAEMFGHPVSEVYVDMEGVFKARGVAPFADTMLSASQKAFDKAAPEEVHRAGQGSA